MKQTANDKSPRKLLTRRKATARLSCHRLGVIAGRPSDVHTILWALQRHRAATLQAPYDYNVSQESTIILVPRCQSKTLRCPYDHRAVPVRGLYDVTAMCLRATGLRFFSNL